DNGLVAQVSYTFGADGTYTIIATREGVEEGFTSGSYTLELAFGDSAVPVPDDSFEDTDGVVLASVRSYNPTDLCELYVSPTTDDEWGVSLIDAPLTYGNYIDLEVVPGLYDVLAVGCDGTEIETYEIEINQDLEIEVYEDEINTYIY
ncbi:MAG: hypothetical protein K8I30_00490, partial [Anaerolineae bacterium]|nr:hypothetical protein [Anaerolineae bacterium]